jgi:O-antigen ligase
LNTSNEINLILGAADRNLGAATLGIALLAYIGGKSLANHDLKYLIIAITFIAFLQSLIVLYQRFLKADVRNLDGLLVEPSVFGTFYNSNPLSYFLGIVCSAIIAYALKSNLSKSNIFFLLISLFIVFLGLVNSGSFQGLLGFLVTFLLYFSNKCFKSIRNRFNLVLIATFGIGVITFLITVLVISVSTTTNITTNPYLERLEIYKSAIAMFINQPIFGAGVDSFASQYGQFTISSDLKLVDNAHSIILQSLSTQGILGCMLFLGFVFWVLRFRYSEVHSNHAQWNFFQSIFFTYVVIGIIGIDHPVISFLAFLSAGVLRGKSEKSIRDKVSNQARPRVVALCFCVAVLTIFVSFTIIPNALRELKVSNALTQLSTRSISPETFQSQVLTDYESVKNSRLMLTVGQAFVALDNRQQANQVASAMLAKFPDDQRTSVLLFLIADKWSDQDALNLAIDLRDRLFPKLASLK